MKDSILTGMLWAALALLSLAPGLLLGEDEPLFEVRFTRDGVAFAGKVDTEENAQILAESVRAVRPDLAILNNGLRIEESVEMPRLSDLKSLLAELGISTHEGRVSFYEDEVVLGGMTDSPISITALRIRLEPFLSGRTLVNRLCIVSKDDMPKLRVQLSSGEVSGPLFNFDEVPSAEESFEMPGLSLANLFPMVLTLSDLSRLHGKEAPSALGQPQQPLQAVPLMQVKSIGGRGKTQPATIIRAIPAEPQPTLVPLPSLFYTRDSFLLQADQESAIESLIEQITTPPLHEEAVLIRPVKSNGRGGAFGDYLLEKRGAAAKELLIGRGIPEDRIKIEPVELASQIDTGEVRLLVRIPPPLPPESLLPSESAEEESSLPEVGPASQKTPNTDTTQ